MTQIADAKGQDEVIYDVDKDEQLEMSLTCQLNPILFSKDERQKHRRVLKQRGSPHEKFTKHVKQQEDPNTTQKMFIISQVTSEQYTNATASPMAASMNNTKNILGKHNTKNAACG